MDMSRGGAFQLSSQVQQMVGDSPIWWDLNNMRPASSGHQHSSPLFPSSCSSSSSTTSSSTTTTTTTTSSSSPLFPQYSHQPSSTTWHDSQELPESWSRLLLGGLVEEELEDRCSYITPFQAKRTENSSWEDQVLLQLSEEVQAAAAAAARSSNWSQILPSTSSPNNRSSSSMLDFSNAKPDQRKHQHQLLVGDHSSECNSTPAGSPYKKARVQASSAQSTFKARKEKLGDRITALHQLVSPFGKTDTASVLLEAIGYIRFLQSQIQALSSPYLATGSGNIKQQYVQGERNCIFPEDPGQLLNDICMKRSGRPAAEDQDGVDEPRKDLRGRGLCLVPASSFVTHVGSDDAADYWAPTFVGGFR
ncbi:transcription factor bHLH68 isoform X1 [Iris pallida]|uniref:Transcription factor bHLH68 isoform X1 n=1 Tax=Iris pallida TaxID=29817 RepID=A0AAX6GIK3_IRIPA|nr:transcription factor bHLH68 isoform X1 [Iris pallida]